MIARPDDYIHIHHTLYPLMNGCTRDTTLFRYILKRSPGIPRDNIQYLPIQFVYFLHYLLVLIYFFFDSWYQKYIIKSNILSL